MPGAPRHPSRLREAILMQLPPSARDAVERIVRAARMPVFVAGGAVRDAIIGRPIADVDLVLEGDAIAVVQHADPGARVTSHRRFGTASFALGGVRIDVATARRETYARPGGLPAVAPGAIDDDLRRRDFTINALAVRLPGAAALLDPCGGAADIDARIIRLLHDRSFRDDATRIYRALRYAARLGFALEPRTSGRVHRDVGYISMIGGERLRREIELVLLEPAAGAALEAAQAAGLLLTTHPALSWDAGRSDAIAAAAPAPARLPYGFALLAAHARTTDATSITGRLRLKRDEAAAVTGIAAMRDAAKMLPRKDAKPSGVVVLLDRYPPASVAAFAATASDPIARQLALRYLAEWRHIKPLLKGDELVATGIPAGPHIQRGLRLIRAARLDGWAMDRGDELALAMRFAKSIRDSGRMDASDRPPLP